MFNGKLSETENKIVSFHNRYSLELLQIIMKDNKQTNIVLSPYGILTILMIIINGSKGILKEEMLKKMDLNEQEIEKEEGQESIIYLNEYWQKLESLLNYTSNMITVRTANSLWIKKEDNINETFSEITKKYFNLTIEKVDFSSKEDIDKICNIIKENI